MSVEDRTFSEGGDDQWVKKKETIPYRIWGWTEKTLTVRREIKCQQRLMESGEDWKKDNLNRSVVKDGKKSADCAWRVPPQLG